MKTYFVLFLAVILGIALGMALGWLRLAQKPWDGNPPLSDVKSTVKSAAETEPPGPNLVLDQSAFDFGSMEIDDSGSHEFLIKNLGKLPLTIAEKETSCGCLDVEPGQIEIPGGHSDKITLKWKTEETPGRFSESATFSCNDSAKPKFTLMVTGQVASILRAVPRALAFNQISANETATAEARLLCYQDEPFKVLDHQWESPEIASKFQAAFQPLSVEKLDEYSGAHSGYSLKITVKPGLPYGPFQQTIRIKTDLKSRPELTIPIHGSVTGDIKVAGPGWDAEKGVLNLGIVNSRQTFRHQLLLIVRGPHRKEVKFKPVQNPSLPIAVKLGKTSEINDGTITQTPLILEIPQGSRPTNHFGDDPSIWGRIIIETTHPNVPSLQLFVRFAIEG